MNQTQNELPEVITNDPRIGKPATHLRNRGLTAPIKTIYRFKDGYEVISTHNPQTGRGCGDDG